MQKPLYILFVYLLFISCRRQEHAVVFQTDFGLKDGAVNAMKGVAYSVDQQLHLYDLTHEIPAYDIWEAGYRLYQSVPYWPAGTVFVSVVDPGVGTERRSVVVKTKTGHYIVTPDNGTLTLIEDAFGIEAMRQIDEKVNRRASSDSSYTFHGRDVYAYTAARLASGRISFEEVGPVLANSIVRLQYQKPLLEDDRIKGNIPVLDIRYGNVWTNIHDTLFKKLAIGYGQKVQIIIRYKDSVLYQGQVRYSRTFGDVPEGQPLAYINSLMNFSLALNMGNFADSFHIKSGKDWNVTIGK